MYALHCSKFEVPDNICKMHSNPLRNIEYRVQTFLGTFQSQYNHSITSLIHGTGLGLGSSGTHWVYISVFMRSSLEKQNKGGTIISSDNNITWKKKIVGLSMINENILMTGKGTH